MAIQTKEFREAASRALEDSRLQVAHEVVYDGFHQRRLSAAGDTPNWESERTRGKAIKDHTIANLDYYLDKLADNVESHGGNVYFAADVHEANEYVRSVARRNDAKTVIKSKSMVSEEMGLNHVLEADGLEVVETDLGEYIIQLAHEPPYHIIAPAVHKTREQVADLLSDDGEDLSGEDAESLTRRAREQLRSVFRRADMSITGVNFAVAETGSIVLVTNEGNGRMATTVPRVHVAVMGMEKVIPSVADLGTMLRILIRSATGQRISAYVTMVNGPRLQEDADGPEEFHLVIVNNGRDRLLRDESMRESLNCIRCGACMNACPVYRKVGGHAYGWVYPGPIGAVVSPVLTGLKDGVDLPNASTLCGACHEACPVKINIPRMLLELRAKAVEGDFDTGGSTAGAREKLTWKVWRWGMSGRRRYGALSRIGRVALLPLSRRGWLKRAPGPLSGWTASRDFPLPTGPSLAKRLRKRNKRAGTKRNDRAG